MAFGQESTLGPGTATLSSDESDCRSAVNTPTPPGWALPLLDPEALVVPESIPVPVPESLQVGSPGTETRLIIHQLARFNISTDLPRPQLRKHANKVHAGVHTPCGPNPVLSSLQIPSPSTHTATQEVIITIAVPRYKCRNWTS